MQPRIRFRSRCTFARRPVLRLCPPSQSTRLFQRRIREASCVQAVRCARDWGAGRKRLHLNPSGREGVLKNLTSSPAAKAALCEAPTTTRDVYRSHRLFLSILAVSMTRGAERRCIFSSSRFPCFCQLSFYVFREACCLLLSHELPEPAVVHRIRQNITQNSRARFSLLFCVPIGLCVGPLLQTCHTNYRARGATVRSLKTSAISTVDLWPITGRYHQLRRYV